MRILDHHSDAAVATDTALGAAIDDASIQALVDNYTRFLRFLERRVGSREVAEDILQDAFVRGVDRLASVRDTESVVAWFFRLLRNAVTDYYRRRRAEERAHDWVAATAEGEQPGPDAELVDRVCDCVAGLVDTLKPAYTRALHRVDLDGTSVRDYASEEGITPNNAAVRLHRAREALKRQVVRSCGTCAEHRCLDCECKRTANLPAAGPE